MRRSPARYPAFLLALLLLAQPRAARADVMEEEDSACRDLTVGNACDVPGRASGFPGYRGTCELVTFTAWRSRLRCKLPDLGLTPAQWACFNYYKDGSDCIRASGATGVCRFLETRPVPAPGGVGTVAMPILECRHVAPDHRSENRAGLLLAAFAVTAVGIVVGVLRSRRARREPPAS